MKQQNCFMFGSKKWVKGKVLAVGTLHYNSKKSMHRRSKYSNKAVNCSSNYSIRAFIGSLENPLWKVYTPELLPNCMH